MTLAQLDPSTSTPDLPALEREVELRDGRWLSIAETDCGTDDLRIHAPDGTVELRVELTDHGPRLHFRSAQVSLESSGDIALACRRFKVHASEAIEHVSDGDAKTTAKGDAEMRGRECKIRATRGEVFIKANDDARIHGERVMLNC